MGQFQRWAMNAQACNSWPLHSVCFVSLLEANLNLNICKKKKIKKIHVFPIGESKKTLALI